MQESQRQRAREIGMRPSGGIFDEPAAAVGTVDVAHGPYRETLPVAQMTVGEVRRRFQDYLDIAPGAVALVDGNQVGDDTRLSSGEMLMFVRPAGEKGMG